MKTATLFFAFLLGAMAAQNNGNGSSNNNNNGKGAAQQSSTNNNDPQTSTTLDPRVIIPGIALDGQLETGADAGQVASLTSTNNFINICLSQQFSNVPLTNGQQVKTGSCNSVPMGAIIAQDKCPSSKFTGPKNGDTIPANQDFTISMAVKNLATGSFTNAQTNYFAAPAQVNAQGILIGHTHVVVEAIDSLASTTPTDTTTFAFFKGINTAADANGVVSASVAGGLPAGFYRISSINSAANHQQALCAVAQRGSTDDAVYITVADQATGGQQGGGSQQGNGGQSQGGNKGSNQGNGQNNNAVVSSTSAAAVPATTTVTQSICRAGTSTNVPQQSSSNSGSNSNKGAGGRNRFRNGGKFRQNRI